MDSVSRTRAGSILEIHEDEISSPARPFGPVRLHESDKLEASVTESLGNNRGIIGVRAVFPPSSLLGFVDVSSRSKVTHGCQNALGTE